MSLSEEQLDRLEWLDMCLHDPDIAPHYSHHQQEAYQRELEKLKELQGARPVSMEDDPEELL